MKEPKNYIGTSRPVGQYDRDLLLIVEADLQRFNAIRQSKSVLTVEHYVDGGDWWRLQKNNKVILPRVTLRELFCAVSAITEYYER